MMKQIEDFVYDPTSKETIVYNLQSYALKKALGKRVTEVYMSSGIFTEFSRAQPETTIRKTERFRQANYIRNEGKKTATTVGDSLGFCDSEEEKAPATPAPKKEKENLDLQASQLLKYEIGFSKVIQKISESKKPFIGHNMKFDVEFFYHQFYREMPETWAEF